MGVMDMSIFVYMGGIIPDDTILLVSRVVENQL